MEDELIRIDYYRDIAGIAPYEKWYDSIRDSLTQTIIDARLARVRLGNFGDSKSVGRAVYELRITHGHGYRIYFGKKNEKVILLLCGGDKGSQKKDIKKAQDLGEFGGRKMKKKPSDHEARLIQRFKENPQRAIDYMNACLEDNDPKVFLLALQDVTKAFGGMTQLAKKTGVSREHLYTTFSEKGNPSFSTLNKALSALDLKMEIKRKTQSRRKVKKSAA